MTKLNDYLITEGRGKSMKKDDAWNWIWMNCKKLMKWMGSGERSGGRFIARSVGGYERNGINYVFIEPKKAATPRVSRNTKNYYTLIMDNEASWKKFPKRSESIICLTDGYDYGSNEYIIFPKDGWKVGNTNERDFWGVVDNIDTRLDNMSDWAEMINVLLNFDNEDRDRNRYDKTLQQFKKRCGEFDNYVDTHGGNKVIEEILKPTQFDYNDMYKLFTETYKGDLYRLLLSHIQPSRLGITLNKVGDNLPKETEIWTDSPCVMIQSFEWKTHREEILGRGK